MSGAGSATTTYRGSTLEEVLPRIREELGPEAVIVRQREGIVGGFGGFFGTKCVEGEARPAAPRPSAPPRAIIDAYDTGEPHTPEGNALLETLLDQSSPFAAELSDALAGDLADAPAGRQQPRLLDEQVELWRPLAATPRADDPATVLADLLTAGFGAALAQEIVADAARTLRPFAPDVPLRTLVQRALERHIRVAAGWETKRRTIALIGTAGSGRTLTAAKLCNAYAGAGRTVAALSLEPARAALELGELTAGGDVGLEIAGEAGSIPHASLRRFQVVIADLPPLDAHALAPAAKMLAALRANETHLVVRADSDAEEGRALLELLSGPLKPSRILVTGADRDGPAHAPVALSLAFGVPISFVADGPVATADLHPAEPGELARMAFPSPGGD